MRKYIQSISILLIFIQLGISSDKLTANQFVENSIKRLDNIDCKMIINGKSIEGKGKEEKTSFEIYIHWVPESENLETYKKIYIKELVEEGKKGKKLWVHFRKDKKDKKWMMLPRSGKIKDITDKKSSQKVDLSSISFPLETLKNEMVFLDDEKVNEVLCKVVEIKDEDGNIRLWIDPVDFLIHKKVYYNKKSEVSREATFSDLIEYEGLKFYKKESIYNIRKETTVEMSLKEFEKTTFDNLDKFNTPLKK